MVNESDLKKPFFFALVLHGLLFVAIFCVFVFPSDPHSQPMVVTSVRIIEAVAVDQKVLDKQLAAQKQAKELIAQQARDKKLKELAEAQRLKELERQRLLALKKHREDLRQQEKAKAEALAKQKEAQEMAAAAEAKAVALKKQAEIKKQAEAKKQQAEMSKHVELRRQAAFKRQQELEKQKRDEKRLAEAAKKKQATAELAKKQSQEKVKKEEDLLQQQIAEEERQIASAKKNQYRNEVEKYRGLISQAISQYWIVPEALAKDLSCVLLIRVGEGGTVQDVKLARSSGAPPLDRSAIAAVYKASPLPVPDDSELFDMFREIRLTVRPDVSLNETA